MKQPFIGLCALLLAVSVPSGASCGPERPTSGSPDAPLYLAVGSYASAKQEGIRIYRFDAQRATADYAGGLTGIANPSYLVASSDGDHLYAVAENGAGDSWLNHLRFDRRTGTPTFADRQPAGAAPCYVALDPAGRFAATADYMGAGISLFALAADGSLAGAPRTIRFKGHGPDRERQEQPHLHSVVFTPDNRTLLACDLGLDRIHCFPLDPEARGTAAVDTDRCSDLAIRPGAGPRHLRFRPDGRFAYLIGELSGEVTVLAHRRGALRPVQYIAADTTGARGSADIRIAPDGRHLYVSNRLKNDGLAIFSIDARRGTLTPVGYCLTGPHPRNFVLTPDGRFVLVACRDEDAIRILRRDPSTGLLHDTGRTIRTPQPVCLEFVR